MEYLMSIVIPVYNQMEYLATCIESVLKNNKKGIEILLVDDGSTDGSGDICDKYSKENDDVFVYHKKNGGLSSARNYGIRMSKGEYIFFLDSDDKVTDDFIDDIYEYISQKKYDLILFDYCFENKGRYKLHGKKNIIELGMNDTLELLVKNRIGNQICFKVYNKKLFDNIEFPINRNYEDIATFYKLLMKSKCNLMINYSYYLYNVSNVDSITKKFNKKNLTDMYCSINEFYEGLYELCRIYKLHEYLEYYKRNTYIYIYLKSKNCKDEIDELRQMISNYLWKNKKYNFIKYRYYSNLRRIYFYITTIIERRKHYDT